MATVMNKISEVLRLPFRNRTRLLTKLPAALLVESPVVKLPTAGNLLVSCWESLRDIAGNIPGNTAGVSPEYRLLRDPTRKGSIRPYSHRSNT